VLRVKLTRSGRKDPVHLQEMILRLGESMTWVPVYPQELGYRFWKTLLADRTANR